MIFKSIVIGAMCAAFVSTSMSAKADTPFPLGTYVGNPNGNDSTAEAQFETQFNSFSAAMGTKPIFMNAFVDGSHPLGSWSGPNGDGWTAWSWAISPVVGLAVTPVIGVPLTDNADGWGNNTDQTYKAIAAGQYDADFRGLVDDWAGQGYTNLFFRLGYEGNGSFMAWYAGDTPAENADWVSAFQRVATDLRAEATAKHVTAHIVWNLNEQAWSATPGASLYPGDQYVDDISVDVYSGLYPSQPYWDVTTNSVAPSYQAWLGKARNRVQQLRDPSYTEWNLEGQVSGSPPIETTGWSLIDAINMAETHGKPISVSETGDGLTGPGPNSLRDDPVFPKALSQGLDIALAAGVKVEYVNIWDANLSDGSWGFSQSSDNKPATKKAWSSYFGAR